MSAFDSAGSATISITNILLAGTGDVAVLGVDYAFQVTHDYAQISAPTVGPAPTAGIDPTAGTVSATSGVSGTADATDTTKSLFGLSYNKTLLTNLSGQALSISYSYTLDSSAFITETPATGFFNAAISYAISEIGIYGPKASTIVRDDLASYQSKPESPLPVPNDGSGALSKTDSGMFSLIDGQQALFSVKTTVMGRSNVIALPTDPSGIVPVPVLPALPLLASGVGALWLLRKRAS
ncbi:hypothetical protein [Pseudoruegeria sp. SK021]|uniref:hypothetical protein n=1 Tax=Pseudoruegeria sp. SK021 TaxID=1933035 RepID=UPI00111C52F3|nr:hypothetical protein [Pseudoruegeria sp. SK021]